MASLGRGTGEVAEASIDGSRGGSGLEAHVPQLGFSPFGRHDGSSLGKGEVGDRGC